MKKIAFLILFFGLVANSYADQKDDLLEFYENYNKEIILPQLEAWQEVAEEYIPYNENDIVSVWANANLDSVAEYIKNNPTISLYEQRAKLSQYQSIIATGITYPYAWIDYYKAPHPSLFGREMLKDSNMAFALMEREKFKSGETVLSYESKTYLNFVVYLILNAISVDGEYSQFEGLIEDNNNRVKFISMLFETTKNEVQSFHYATLINNLSFFQTLLNLIKYSGATEYFKEHKGEYEEISRWFDQQTDRLLGPLYSNGSKELEIINAEDFLEIEKQVTEYKVTLISDLAEVLRIGKENLKQKDKN